MFLLASSELSYFGTLTNSAFVETSAIGSLGLISSTFGLENLVFFNNFNLYSWYYGESFLRKIKLFDNSLSNFDILQFANLPFNIFGDMNVPPYLATPNDDHNWVISNSLEKNYFDSVKLQKSSSDVVSGSSSNY